MFVDELGRAQRVAAYGVCRNDDAHLLLVRLNERTLSPGLWTLPGGGIDFGEDPVDAVVRECREETGYDVVVRGLLGVGSLCRPMRRFDTNETVDYHAVRIIYDVEIVGGSLQHETDNSSDMAAWHPSGELLNLRVSDLVHTAIALSRT